MSLSNATFWLRSFLPRKLPIGMSTFNQWVADVVRLSGLPNNESVRRVSAEFILKLPPALAYLSLRKVSNQLIKAAANQVAVEVLRPPDAPKA
jgi:hypothetical protein